MTHTGLTNGYPSTYYNTLTNPHNKDEVHSSLQTGSQVKVLAKSLFNVITAGGMRHEMDQT